VLKARDVNILKPRLSIYTYIPMKLWHWLKVILKSVKKMGKRLATTPRSKVRAAIRRLFLYSREHQATLKNAERRCSKCGVKASMAKGREIKVQVHHINGIEWDNIINYIFEQVLVDPKKMVVLCNNCHSQLHKGEVKNGVDVKS
jgi:predicted HNH restriction endonuclease